MQMSKIDAMTLSRKLKIIQHGQEWQDKGLRNTTGVRSLRSMC